MGHTEQLESLQKALHSAGVDDAFSVLDKILSLQGQVEATLLQQAYVDGLIAFLGKNPPSSYLSEVDRRLRQTPAYAEEPEKQIQHAQALRELVRRKHSHQEAAQVAGAVAGVKGYGSRLGLQEIHAEALFEASQIPGARPMQLAEEIQQIPSYRDSASIQFALARLACDATTRMEKTSEIDRALGMIESLPLLQQDERLQESHQRAQRNKERLSELSAKAPKSSGQTTNFVIAGAISLLLCLFAAPLFWWVNRPIPQATPTTSAIDLMAQQEKELESYLGEALSALEEKNFDEATTKGLMAMRLAEMLGKQQAKADSLDVLGTAYARDDQMQQADRYWKQLSPNHLSTLAERHVAAAESAKDKEQVATEVELALHLMDLNPGADHSALLNRVANRCVKSGSLEQASVVRERMGELDQASKLAEQAGQMARAVTLLERHVEKHPEEKAGLVELKRRSGEATLKLARTALAEKKLEEAETHAKAAALSLDGLDEAKEERAQAYTVRAKVAYHKEDYPAAVKFARQAHDLSPNKDREARLKTYAYKDAELVTADELVVDTFVFPPTEKTDKLYSYAYYFGANGNYVSGGQERLFQGPDDEIKVSRQYSRRRGGEGISVRVRSLRGDWYSFEFQAGRDKKLAPGVYENASRAGFNYKNPGLSFSGRGRACNTSEGKFVVHEIEWGGYRNREVKAFAADFITSCHSRSATFGKVRYRSHYK